MRLPLFHVRPWVRSQPAKGGQSRTDLPGGSASPKAADAVGRTSSEVLPHGPVRPMAEAVAPVPAPVAQALSRALLPSSERGPAAVLTLAGLRRWVLAADVRAHETTERLQVAQQILLSHGLEASDIEPLLRNPLAPAAGVSRYAQLKWRLLGLDVRGDLRLQNLLHLTSLPEGLVVRGSCHIAECAALTALPRGLVVDKDLTVTLCPTLSQLHPEMKVLGLCTLSACEALTVLPQRLMHVHQLRLGAGLALTEFPPHFNAGGTVELRQCTHLVRLGEGFKTRGSLTLEGCSRLSLLPEGMTVGRDLYIDGGNGFTALPARVRVGGNLSIRFDAPMTALGEELRVGGSIEVVGNPNFVTLPEHMELGGNLSVFGCTRLTSLPESLAALGCSSGGRTRFIDVGNTGVSLERVQHLRERQAFGMTFRFENLKYSKSRALQNLLNHFELQPCSAGIDAWPKEQQQILFKYLGRARKTADHRHVAVRPALFERLRLFVQAANVDATFRARALELLEDSMVSCGDRIIQGLDQVELALALDRAKMGDAAASRAALAELGMQFFMLQVVHEHAAAHCLAVPDDDEVEVYLAFETQLRTRLQLPGSTRFMLFNSKVRLEEVEAAAVDAGRRSGDRKAVAAFFRTWSPWQQVKRRQRAEALPFERLPQRPRELLPGGEPLVCPFTQAQAHELQDAVFLGDGGQTRVFSHRDLMTWWIEHGSDPTTRAPMKLDGLWRVG